MRNWPTLKPSCSGCHILPMALSEILSPRKSPAQVQQELTAREREVLRWTAAGKTSYEIGVILGIATRTVNFHISIILLKLDAINKTQAVVKAVMFDLLS